MAKRVEPKEAAQWLAIGLGLLVLIPWIKKLTPGPDDEGAESVNCGPGPFTLSEIQARSIADTVDAAVSDVVEDEEAVLRALTQVRTDGDVCMIIKAYGSRRVAFGIGPYNLPQVVSMYLNERVSIFSPTTYIDAINEDYSSKGISFRF